MTTRCGPNGSRMASKEPPDVVQMTPGYRPNCSKMSSKRLPDVVQMILRGRPNGSRMALGWRPNDSKISSKRRPDVVQRHADQRNRRLQDVPSSNPMQKRRRMPNGTRTWGYHAALTTRESSSRPQEKGGRGGAVSADGLNPVREHRASTCLRRTARLECTARAPFTARESP